MIPLPVLPFKISSLALLSSIQISNAPIAILALSIGLIVWLITRYRLHAFFSLMSGAMVVGLCSAALKPEGKKFSQVIEQVMHEFGGTAGKLGFSIAIAAVIGKCLMESGAADKIIRCFIAILGEARAALALLGCSFVLCAPVFYDTVMLLMMPLARALSLRVGRNYLLYVLAICAGGSISNGIVPPAPGPLFVAESLKLDLGTAIFWGFLFGIPPALCAYFAACWINSRMQVPVREIAGSSLSSLEEIAAKPESSLPSLAWSVAPIVVPVLMIAAASLGAFLKSDLSAVMAQALEFFGNKNVALSCGAAVAVALLARQNRSSVKAVIGNIGSCAETAGVIILIVSAGGAYGAMIKHSGVGECVRELAGGRAIPYVLLAWGISALIRAAQGSATVATITAVGILQSIAGNEGFGVHPVYILISIGLGSKFLNWMNDAGFWVVSRFSGLTQEELLRSWTVLVSLLSVFGLMEVLLLSSLFPNLWY